MGRLKVKGKAGAAKNYTTRSAAIKKLQCSLADFRRLCILKGIFPREPRNKKKANKGSSAPTSFYYTKDIAYLAHEPILKKLREHKAFAKKLSRALGRGEWASAKSLEENKPIYRLDHIIKERYPTFLDALRDIDDALCMAFLFSSLPSTARVPPDLVANCSRLASEWQCYVMHTKALRKVFLSIKGIYYQADVMDQTVTWLVPYQFTQSIPLDVDVRVMLTFLEFYQTLLSFVFFKLYTDAGLVYPPPIDSGKDEGGAGLNALTLLGNSSAAASTSRVIPVDTSRVSSKSVRQTIKDIARSSTGDTHDSEMVDGESIIAEEEFVVHPSSNNQDSAASSLPTLQNLSSLPPSTSTELFSPYTLFLSREISRPVFEFVVRCFGGRVGWPASTGSGSPFAEDDPSITHVIIDRPLVENNDPIQRELRSRRKYVQPQWVVDSINSGKILLEDAYGQGKTLPPHLSPFGEVEGAYLPPSNLEDDTLPDNVSENNAEVGSADVAIAAANDDPAALRTAELAAEAAGVDHGEFEAKVRRAGREAKKTTTQGVEEAEKDMNKMMMSNKQRKLYEKMKYSQQKSASERAKLEERRKELRKEKKT